MMEEGDILERIKEIEGVKGVFSVDSDGALLNSVSIPDAEEMASLVAFIITSGINIGFSLGIGAPFFSIVEMNNAKLIVITGDEVYIGVIIEPGTSMVKTVKIIQSLITPQEGR